MADDRIDLFGEWASSNLGDAVLAECSAYLLRQVAPRTTIRLRDLRGRGLGGWASLCRRAGLRPSGGLVDDLKRCPPARRVVIGGGNLLIDNKGLFPRHLGQIIRTVSANGGQVAFLACGARGPWETPESTELRTLLADPCVVRIGLRDPRSAESVRSLVPSASCGMPVEPDPAIWAALAFGSGRLPAASHLGLCITCPQALARHGGEPPVGESWIGRWTSLAASLAPKSPISVFCNGAPADMQAAKSVSAALSGARIPHRLLPRATSARALVRQISGCRLVIGHRLHACLTALALGRKAIALRWDPKVDNVLGWLYPHTPICDPADLAGITGSIERILDAPPAPPAAGIHELSRSSCTSLLQAIAS